MMITLYILLDGENSLYIKTKPDSWLAAFFVASYSVDVNRCLQRPYLANFVKFINIVSLLSDVCMCSEYNVHVFGPVVKMISPVHHVMFPYSRAWLPTCSAGIFHFNSISTNVWQLHVFNSLNLVLVVFFFFTKYCPKNIFLFCSSWMTFECRTF